MKYFYWLLLFSNFLFSQINESDNVAFQLRINATGNYQQGNVSLMSLRNKIDFSFRPFKSFVVKSQNASLYQEFSNKKADFDIFSRNYIYYKPEELFYPYMIGYFSSNYRRQIDYRYFVGFGATYQLIKKQNHSLKISSNVVYESTNYSTANFNFSNYNENEAIQLWRTSLYLSGYNYFFDKKFKIFYEAIYQPSFEDSKNYRSEFELGFEFPVYKGFSINATYRFFRENIVPVNIKQEDKILTFGLSYNFKSKE